jgi:hypothetical protein
MKKTKWNNFVFPFFRIIPLKSETKLPIVKTDCFLMVKELQRKLADIRWLSETH